MFSGRSGAASKAIPIFFSFWETEEKRRMKEKKRKRKKEVCLIKNGNGLGMRTCECALQKKKIGVAMWHRDHISSNLV